MEQFVQILKDIINGVPSAYDDLDKLFREHEGRFDKLFGSLPPYLQSLVIGLPGQLWASFGSDVASSMSSKKAAAKETRSASSTSTTSRMRGVPTLKSLLTQRGAVVTALRSIFEYLELHFPAFMTGSNILMSFAVFRKP